MPEYMYEKKNREKEKNSFIKKNSSYESSKESLDKNKSSLSYNGYMFHDTGKNVSPVNLLGVSPVNLPLNDKDINEAIVYNKKHLNYFKKDCISDFLKNNKKNINGSKILKTYYSNEEEKVFLSYITGFQEESSIKIDGKVGPDTLGALETSGFKLSSVNIGSFKYDFGEYIQENLEQNKEYLLKRKSEYLKDYNKSSGKDENGLSKLVELKKIDNDILMSASKLWSQYEYINKMFPVDAYVESLMNSSGGFKKAKKGKSSSIISTDGKPANDKPSTKQKAEQDKNLNSIEFNPQRDGAMAYMSAVALYESLNSLRSMYPELGILREDDVTGKSNEDLRDLLEEKFDDIIKSIDDMKSEVFNGNFPIEKLDLSIESFLKSDSRYKDDKRIKSDVEKWLKEEAANEKKYAYIGTGLTIGLTVAAILAAPFSGGASLLLALGGSISGLSSSIYNFERYDDIYNAAKAGQSKNRFLSDPDAARFNYYMGVLDLTLSIVDLSLAGKGAKELVAAGRLKALRAGNTGNIVKGTKAAELDDIRDIVSRIRQQVDKSLVAMNKEGTNLLDDATLAMLRSAESTPILDRAKAVKKFFKLFRKTKFKALTNEIDELKRLTRDMPIPIDDFLTINELQKLTNISGVEWVIHRTGGIVWIRSGSSHFVTFNFTGATTDFIHTHLTNIYPSLEDIFAFYKLTVESGSSVRVFKLVAQSKYKAYEIFEIKDLIERRYIRWADLVKGKEIEAKHGKFWERLPK